MTKQEKIYRIFMTTMIVIIAGLLLATGIIAIQKQMKLKANIEFLPGINVEIYVNEESEEGLLFRNFEDTSDANNKKYIEFNSTYCELSANTLTMKDAFVTAYGNNFTLIVKNYSGFTIETNITSTATAKIGENSFNAVPAEITPPTAQIDTGKSGEFVISCEPVVPQSTTISIQFEEFVPPYTIGTYTSEYTSGTEPAIGTKLTDNTVYYPAFNNYKYLELEGVEYPQTYASDYADKTYAEMLELSSSYEDNYLSDGTGQNALSSGDICTINGERYYFQNRMPYYDSSGASSTYYTEYTSGWYKFEPIRWIIIGAGSDMSDTYGAGATLKNGEVGTNQLLLISELTLYATQFDRTHYTDSTTSNNRYYTGDADTTSDVYYSINTGFSTRGDTNYYRDAPDAAHMRSDKHFAALSGLSSYYDTYINETSMTKTTSYYGTEDTSQHYIFLMGGVSGDSYYIGTYLNSTSLRISYSSDFAKATSVYKNSSTGASSWWLRSGSSSSADLAYRVNPVGSVYDNTVDFSYYGVRPGFCLNLA